MAFMENLQKYIDAIENTNCGQLICGKTTADGALIMPYADYSTIIYEMMKEFFATDIVNYNYLETARELLDNFDVMIHTMTAKQVGTCLTYIFRGERFCEGLILTHLQNGKIVACLKRLMELDELSHI